MQPPVILLVYSILLSYLEKNSPGNEERITRRSTQQSSRVSTWEHIARLAHNTGLPTTKHQTHYYSIAHHESPCISCSRPTRTNLFPRSIVYEAAMSYNSKSPSFSYSNLLVKSFNMPAKQIANKVRCHFWMQRALLKSSSS